MGLLLNDTSLLFLYGLKSYLQKVSAFELKLLCETYFVLLYILNALYIPYGDLILTVQLKLMYFGFVSQT